MTNLTLTFNIPHPLPPEMIRDFSTVLVHIMNCIIWCCICVLPVAVFGAMMCEIKDPRGLGYHWNAVKNLFWCYQLFFDLDGGWTTVEEVKPKIHGLLLKYIIHLSTYLPQPLNRATPLQLDYTHTTDYYKYCTTTCPSRAGRLCPKMRCESYHWHEGVRVYRAPDIIDLWWGMELGQVDWRFSPVIQGKQHVFAPPGYYIYEEMFHFAPCLRYEPIWGVEPIPLDQAPTHAISQAIATAFPIEPEPAPKYARPIDELFATMDKITHGHFIHVLYLTIWLGYLTLSIAWWWEILGGFANFGRRIISVSIPFVGRVVVESVVDLAGLSIWITRLSRLPLEIAKQSSHPVLWVFAYGILSAYFGSIFVFLYFDASFRNEMYDRVVGVRAITRELVIVDVLRLAFGLRRRVARIDEYHEDGGEDEDMGWEVVDPEEVLGMEDGSTSLDAVLQTSEKDLGAGKRGDGGKTGGCWWGRECENGCICARGCWCGGGAGCAHGSQDGNTGLIRSPTSESMSMPITPKDTARWGPSGTEREEVIAEERESAGRYKGRDDEGNDGDIEREDGEESYDLASL